MDELWPALGPTAAAANLRKAIHFARRAVGAEHIVVRHELVELAGSDVWVDVDAFETARRAGDADTAVALYADDLLTEDRFEPWAEERREQLRREFAEVLLDVGRERERLGDGRGAVQAFERLVAVDPFHEEAYCGLLRLNAAEGHRHLALRWYRQLEDRLREDWGTEPGAGIRRLRDAVIADDGAATGPRTSLTGGRCSARRPIRMAASGPPPGKSASWSPCWRQGSRSDAPSRSSVPEAVGSLRRAQAAIGAEIVEGWGGAYSPVRWWLRRRVRVGGNW